MITLYTMVTPMQLLVSMNISNNFRQSLREGYLSLGLPSSWTVGSQQVSPGEVPLSQLTSSHITEVVVSRGNSPECLNLHPAHKMLGSLVLI